MSCEKMEELMADALGGEATPADRERLEAHLNDCGRCRREYESSRGLLDQLQALRDVAPVEREWPAWQTIPATDAERIPSRSATRWFRFAASILLAFVAGYGARSLQRSPSGTAETSAPVVRGIDRSTFGARTPQQALADAADGSFGSAWLRARLSAPGRSDFAACLLAMRDSHR
jgi:predicted anti-sigma-YlaC factor YlaD